MHLFKKKKARTIIDNNFFVHLHVHSNYSLLDGESSPTRLAQKAKALGMPALALTDHNHLLGVIDFQKACKEAEILPIFGLESYYTNDTEILSKTSDERYALALEKAIEAGVIIPSKATKKFIKELIIDYIYPTKQFHILFLAKDNTGYKTLVKLQSEASRLCTYNGRYIVDNNLLRKYHDGLIMTTACIGSRTAQLITKGKKDEAEQLILEWHKIFQDDFYLEIQPLMDIEQAKVNEFYMQMSDKWNIKLIATNDVHYTDESDIDDHDTVLCVGMGKTKYDPERMRYSPEFWLKSLDEMKKAFKDQMTLYVPSNTQLEYYSACLIALSNTKEVYSKIKDDINLGSDKSLFPQVQIPDNKTPEFYLSQLCFKKLYQYASCHKEIKLSEYERRLNYELNIINPKGFAPYMVINDELVTWCKENKIPTGPGRGSAAGSLILFLLGITKLIDPIKYQLLFSRFLTKDRTSNPDIDVDYSYKNRHRVIAHLQETYGFSNVSHIGTITYEGVKSGIKDFARVLDIPYETANEITAKIDEIMGYETSYKFKHIDALQNSDLEQDQKVYKQFKELEVKYPELFRLARKYEGTPRNTGIHASGVLITPVAVSDVFPTITNNGVQVALFTGEQLDSFNALKLDVLGLKTLDIINDTIISVDSFKNIYDFYDDNIVPFAKSAYFKDICKLETEGIFQIESDLFKSIIKNMQPHNINDITALTSIARPGPLSAGMHTLYNDRKNGKEEWGEPLPNTLEFVKDTYGTIIYQEQCMQIAQRVAGFDDNQADSFLRKSLAKKKVELLQLCKQWFVYGKVNAVPPKGYDPENKKQTMYDETGKYGVAIKGGIVNGYDETALIDFFDSLRGYAAYLFNKSHAAAYSALTCISAYLIHHYRAKFFAQVLTMEDKKEKVDFYVDNCKEHCINVLLPDINRSQEDFIAIDEGILYGLKSIASVKKSASYIIENRPYNSINEIMERIPKKFINKTVVVNLIKSGCFDAICDNRNTLINQVFALRKEKTGYLEELDYTPQVCCEYELSTIKTALSYPSTWKSYKEGDEVEIVAELKDYHERNDKKGNLMGFFILSLDDPALINKEISGLSFASNYGKFRLLLIKEKQFIFKGKKDSKGKLLISNAKLATPKALEKLKNK